MAYSSPASVLDVDLRPGRPPVLRAEAAGPSDGGAAGWAAEHRDSLRAVVAEHGCVLVRGLGLADADSAGAVFRGLAGGLMTEREAFAARRTYADGVYSASKWPANQQMCMHHELSYLLEFPGLLLFACLTAATEGGATAVSDSPAVLQALPDADLAAIVDLLLADLSKRLAEQDLSIELTAAAKALIVREGTDPSFGARPLKRTIQRLLENPLARSLVAGEFKPGDTVTVTGAQAANGSYTATAISIGGGTGG